MTVVLAVGLSLTMTSPAFAAFTFDRYTGTGTLDVTDVQGFYGWTRAATKTNAPEAAIEATLSRVAVRTCDGAEDGHGQYSYVTVNRSLQKIKGKQVYVLQGYPAGVWFPTVPPCSAGQTETSPLVYRYEQATAVWTNWREDCHHLYALSDPSLTYGQQLAGCPKPPAIPG